MLNAILFIVLIMMLELNLLNSFFANIDNILMIIVLIAILNSFMNYKLTTYKELWKNMLVLLVGASIFYILLIIFIIILIIYAPNFYSVDSDNSAIIFAFYQLVRVYSFSILASYFIPILLKYMLKAKKYIKR